MKSSLIASDLLSSNNLLLPTLQNKPVIAKAYTVAKEVLEAITAGSILFSKIKEAIEVRKLNAANPEMDETILVDRVATVKTITQAAANVVKELLDILPAVIVLAKSIPGAITTIANFLQKYIASKVEGEVKNPVDDNKHEEVPQSDIVAETSQDIQEAIPQLAIARETSQDIQEEVSQPETNVVYKNKH